MKYAISSNVPGVRDVPAPPLIHIITAEFHKSPLVPLITAKPECR